MTEKMKKEKKHILKQRRRKMASSKLEVITRVKDELICKALFMAMEAQESREKQYLVKKVGSAVLFSFPGSFSPGDWFAQGNRKPFGETKIDRNSFPCLRSIGNDVDATVNEAFLKRLEAVLTASRSLQEAVEKAVNERKQIVFTGHSSGGATAILMTVWFLETYLKLDSTLLPPLCVTFGSPLVGDGIFNHALRRENWAQYFVHFVMHYDIVPRIMLAPKSSIEESLPRILHFLNPISSVPSQEVVKEGSAFYKTVMGKASSVASHVACQLMGNTNPLLETLSSFIELSPYRPFGTYIFCTNGRMVGVNNPDAILQLLFFSSQLSSAGAGPDVAYESIKEHRSYKNILEWNSAMATNLSDHLTQIPLTADGHDPNTNSINMLLSDLGLSTRGRLCIRAAAETEKQRTENEKKIDERKEDIRRQLEKLEGYYKKMGEVCKIGYYDSFKASNEEDDFHANVTRLKLAGVWDEIIEMLKRYELPDGFEGSQDWIKIGTRYRQLVEPLDIANYYRHLKNEDTGPYMEKGRPKRYKYTQRWLEHYQWKSKGSNPEDIFWAEVDDLKRTYQLGSRDEIQDMRKFAGSRTESCFWAEVEELIKEYKEKSFEHIKVRVLVLERMLEIWIRGNDIGKDVLLEESTFVKWWKGLPDQHKSRSRVPELMRY